ncbi:hypothetical protein HQ576_19905 [bacterium]|nr:hypothetical protein [bacterium]
MATIRCEQAPKTSPQRDVRVVDGGGNLLPCLAMVTETKGDVRVVFPARLRITSTLATAIGDDTKTATIACGRNQAALVGMRFQVLGGAKPVATLEVTAVAATSATVSVVDKQVPTIAKGTAVRSDDLTAAEYHIYYGNPAAKEDAPTWKPPESAIAQYTWRVGGCPTSVAQLRELLASNPDLVGATRRTLISSTANPLGAPGDGYLLSVYETYIHIDTPGLYRFSIDTDGPSFLYVNGEFVAIRPGFFIKSRQWEHRGKTKLPAGYHHLLMLAVESASGVVTRLGWQPITAKVYGLAPTSLFASQIEARVVGYDTREQRRQVFFTHDMANTGLFLDPLLAADDLLDPQALCNDLAAAGEKKSGSPGYAFWRALADDTQKLVAETAGGTALTDERKATLLAALNTAIRDARIYRSSYFAKLELPAEVQNLGVRIKAGSQVKELTARLNRILLQTAYPKAVASSHSYQFVQLHNHTARPDGQPDDGVSYVWKFGDDEESQAASPGHLFAIRPDRTSFAVSLAAVVAGKPAGSYQRTIHLGTTPTWQLRLAGDIVSFPNIVYEDERTSVAVRLRNASRSPVLLRAVGLLRFTRDGKPATEPVLRQRILIRGQDEGFCILPVDMKSLPGKRADVSLDLYLSRRKVISAGLRVIPSPEELATLRGDMGGLYDSQGRRCMMAIRIEDPDRHLRWVFYRYLRDSVYASAAGTRRNILLFGDRMANLTASDKPAADYVTLLQQALEKEKRTFQFVQRSQEKLPTLPDLVLLAKTLADLKSAPHIIVLSPGLADVEEAVGERDFARAAEVMIDRIRAVSDRIKIILVSPPPFPGNRRRSDLYTRQLARVAREHHLPFIHLAELLTAGKDDWVTACYGAPDAEGMMLRGPNEATHRRIAEAISKELH